MVTRSAVINSSVLAPIKIYEILLIWTLILSLWHLVLTNFFGSFQNAEYLQWPLTAISIICVSKHRLARENLKFDAFLGAPLHPRDVFEITVVLLFSVALGIGSWAALILIEANVDLEWTFLYWGLISPEIFDGIRWLPQWLVINLIAGVIVVPITEEIIFRGFVLGRLREKYGVIHAIIVSSLIFAVFHLDKSFIGSFAHGVIFAILAVRFSSLYAPMLVHGLYNAAVSVLQTRFGIFMSVEKPRISSASYWSAELVCLVIGVVFLGVYLLFLIRLRATGKVP